MPGKTNVRKLTADQMNRLIMWDNEVPQWADKLPTKSHESWMFMLNIMASNNIANMVRMDPEHKSIPQYELDEFMKKLNYTRYIFRGTGLKPGDDF